MIGKNVVGIRYSLHVGLNNMYLKHWSTYIQVKFSIFLSTVVAVV